MRSDNDDGPAKSSGPPKASSETEQARVKRGLTKFHRVEAAGKGGDSIRRS